MSDPTFEELGMESMEIDLEIVIEEQGETLMSYYYSHSLSYSIGGGYSYGQSWVAEANLAGHCVDGEIQLQGTQVVKMEMEIPYEALDQSYSLEAMDQFYEVSVTGYVKDGIIEGNLSFKGEPAASDVKFTALRVN